MIRVIASLVFGSLAQGLASTIISYGVNKLCSPIEMTETKLRSIGVSEKNIRKLYSGTQVTVVHMYNRVPVIIKTVATNSPYKIGGNSIVAYVPHVPFNDVYNKVYTHAHESTMNDTRMLPYVDLYDNANHSDVIRRPRTDVDILNKSHIEVITVIDKWVAEYNAGKLQSSLIILLHGEPGTGKSQLTREALARFGHGVNIIDLTSIRPNDLRLNSSGMVYSLDDIEKAPCASNRDIGGSSANHSPTKDQPSAESSYELSTSRFLNALSGTVIPTNSIIIMSTNHLDMLDPAVYRPGRVNLVHEIVRHNSDEIHKVIRKWYKKDPYPDYVYDDVTLGNLYDAYHYYPDDAVAFHNRISSL